MKSLKDEYLHYNMMTTYFGGEIVLYKGDKYLIEISELERKLLHKRCILGENPETSRYFGKI